MNPTLRKSISVKISAVGFILFILFGNFLLLEGVTGTQPPAWMQTGFFLSLLIIALGGVGMAIQSYLFQRRG